MYSHQVYNGLASKIGFSTWTKLDGYPYEQAQHIGPSKSKFLAFSYTYLLGCLRYGEKHAKYILISCGCMLMFTNMKFSCKHGGDGVSTWAKFDGPICPVIMQKYISLCFFGLLFTCKYIVYKHVNK